MSDITFTSQQNIPACAVGVAACAVKTGSCAYFYGYWFSQGLT